MKISTQPKSAQGKVTTLLTKFGRWLHFWPISNQISNQIPTNSQPKLVWGFPLPNSRSISDQISANLQRELVCNFSCQISQIFNQFRPISDQILTKFGDGFSPPNSQPILANSKPNKMKF